MTKKDFELIARTIRARREGANGDDPWMAGFRAAHTALARDFADALAASNPRFDRESFLRACGVEAGR
jgi:hypothetical protein